MATSARLLELLALLQNHRYWPGDELARRLEVSRRTLRRDVEQLRDLGYPVLASRGVGGGYHLAPGGSLPPLTVDDEEAVAIVLGLRSATTSSVAGVAEAAARALTKVVAVLPVRLRRIAAGLERAVPPTVGGSTAERTVDLGVLTAVAGACRDRETIAFGYRRRDGERSSRRVEPHALVPYGSVWYLVAYDLEAHDWRTFRLDRMEQVSAQRRHVAPRPVPYGDPTAYVVSAVEEVARPHRVEVIVQAEPGRVLAEVGGWGEVEELEPGTCRVRMRVDSLDWAVFLLGCLDAPFSVHEPPELTEHLQRWASRLGAVDDAGRPGYTPVPGSARAPT